MRKAVLAVMLAGVLLGPSQALAKVEALDPAGAGTPASAAGAVIGNGSLLTGSGLPERPFGSTGAVSSVGVGDSSVGPAPQSLAGFPTAGDTYAILSTGEIKTVASSFTGDVFGSTEFPSQTSPAPALRGVARDWTVLRLDVDVPAPANCLAFDFRFLSEEFPKYIGSDYNDAFVAELDANTWSVLQGGELVRPNDFAASPLGEPISVNGVGPTEMTTGEADGTYFNAATQLLTTRTLVTPGAHSLYLSIFDASDKKYDSAVFVDNLRFVKVAPSLCKPLTTQPLVPLTVATAGEGNGTVTSDPAGIECGSDCEEAYEVGQLIDLTAVPEPGYSFSGWSGAGCSGTGPCEVTVAEAEEVTATFDPLPPPEPPSLTVTEPASPANDTTPLLFGSAPDGTAVSIYLSTDCSGTPVTASATPTELASGLAVAVPANAVTAFSATAKSEAPSPSVCSNSVSYMEDSTAPAATIGAKPDSPSGSAAASFSFTGADPGGSGVAGFECKLDDGAFAACTSPKAYGSLGDGSHRFQVRATDLAGNVEPAPASYTWKVDTSVPAQTPAAALVGLTPVNGKSVAVAPEAGKVFVKRPGQPKFAPLKEGQTIPVGSLVDATSGKAALTSINPAGVIQTATFYAGRFLVAQQEGSGLVSLRLRGGSFSSCAAEGRKTRASASGGRGRKLWGSGKGDFKTEGNSGSATVRGTIWLTEDRCDGTFFEVKRGVVAVRDFGAGKTLSLPAGKSYFAESG
ncbi:MAG TPA: choice-of-anchor L domain-containing protein [Solirubrobacterales bacterium]|nr:choice-of-anchor L domain-containing protein [Solirubrobacterales bacterium]